jgi:hypothetical protein
MRSATLHSSNGLIPHAGMTTPRGFFTDHGGIIIKWPDATTGKKRGATAANTR